MTKLEAQLVRNGLSGDRPNSDFQRYATTGQRGVARRLVRAALAAGYAVSVHDGEELTVDKATKSTPVLGALCTTGQDLIVIYAADTDGWRWVGSFLLIWDNEENGEDLISDYTANSACDALYRAANAPFGS